MPWCVRTYMYMYHPVDGIRLFFVLIQIGARVYSESDLQTLSSHMKKEIDDEVNRILEVWAISYIKIIIDL